MRNHFVVAEREKITIALVKAEWLFFIAYEVTNR